MMDKLKMHSPDLTQDNITKIQKMFPSCVTEAMDDNGKIRLAVDFDQLRQELSDSIVDGPQERYHLNWPGKREALITANAPIAKTLRPYREESVDFDTTQNLFIEGDNLDALKLLQETYLGKVKMIYIDPPYNTGNDFIYDDDFTGELSEYFLASNQETETGNKLVANPEANGRFHSDWLSMMYSRLKLARNILKDNGVVFISISDVEQANLKKICDNVFGAANFLGCAARVTKKANNKGDYWSPNFDYVLTYAKNEHACDVFFGGVNYAAYNQVDKDGPRAGEAYQLVRLYMSSLDPRPNQRYYVEAPDGTLLIPPGNVFPEELADGAKVTPESGEDKVWRWAADSYSEKRNEIIVKKVKSSNLVDSNGNEVKWNVFTKTYLNDVIAKSSAKPNSLIEDHINQNSSHELGGLKIPFSFAKPSSLIKYLCEISRVNSTDIVMDFFAGSGSAGHGVMDLAASSGINARFVLIQLGEQLDPENSSQKLGHKFCVENGLAPTVASITKERLRRVGTALETEKTHEGWNKDVGFRVLKIDSSNMADVFYAPDETTQAGLLDFVDNIKPDRTPEDLLFQVLLDWGVDLTLPIRRKTLHGKTVFFVADNALVACFDSGITDELIKDLAARQPMRVVFRDTAFKDDAAKINSGQIFKSLSPTTDIKAI
ncbi:site-specific DNA-methyltransferase [Planktomarina temperata]|nr:site-specific DNA-methyltransferase [Planktomarina temperata]